MRTLIKEIKGNEIRKVIDPSIIKEDQTRTTENSKHFIMNNGLEKTVISPAKINCFDEKKNGRK